MSTTKEIDKAEGLETNQPDLLLCRVVPGVTEQATTLHRMC